MLKKIKDVMDDIRVFFLTIKYWLQGDDWKFAKEYAESIVKTWENK